MPVTDEDVNTYAASLTKNGFFGPCSYYMNHPANHTYAQAAPNGGRIELPVLFLHGRYDTTCETVNSTLAEPMRELCPNLTEAIVDSGHWMAQERPTEVNRHLVHWLARCVPEAW